MEDPKFLLWEVRHKDEVWTSEGDTGQYVGTFSNPDYSDNSSLAQYVVNMHNTLLDQTKVQPFCYDTLIGELRGVGG